MRAIISLLFWMFIFSFIISIFGNADMKKVVQGFTNNITQTMHSTIGGFTGSINDILNNIKGATNNIPDLNKIAENLNKK